MAELAYEGEPASNDQKVGAVNTVKWGLRSKPQGCGIEKVVWRKSSAPIDHINARNWLWQPHYQ